MVKYYAVYRGHKRGVYKTWDECKSQIEGYSGASYKKFKSLYEAKYFVKYGTIHEKQTLLDFFGNDPPKKKITKSGKEITVYTDGDLITFDGQKYAGYGVYFSDSPEKNIAKILEDKTKTVNRAEMMAIIYAIETLEDELNNGTTLNIYTDSQYSIQCFGSTGQKYQSKEFKKKNGTYYPNHDLIKKGLELVDNKYIRFFKVKSHTDNEDEHSIGNSVADKLAMYGTIKDYNKENNIEDCTITFGKHKGKQICDLPKNYISWILRNNDLHEKFGLTYRAIVHFINKNNNDPLFKTIFNKN